MSNEVSADTASSSSIEVRRSFRMMGFLAKYFDFNDGASVGEAKRRSFAKFAVPPGRHGVVIARPPHLIRGFVLLALVAGMSIAPMLKASSATDAFKHPTAIALDHDGHIWISNQDYFGVTEIEASTGHVIRVINAKTDGFIDPYGIAVAGQHVWIVSGGVEYANGTSHVGTVTELDPKSGSLIRTVSLKKRGVTGLSAVSANNQHVWVAADGGGRVVELSNVTGRILHVYRGPHNEVQPDDVASNNSDVWVVGPEAANGVVERSNVTGRKLKTVTPTHLEMAQGQTYKAPVYLSPSCVTVDARYVWTGNEGGLTFSPPDGSVTQINAATDKIVRTVGSAADRFRGTIQSVYSDGTHVWVVNGSVSYRGHRRGDSITELNAANGSLVRVIQLHDGVYADPVDVVSNGVDVWITDAGGGTYGIGSVIELNASNGAVVRTIVG